MTKTRILSVAFALAFSLPATVRAGIIQLSDWALSTRIDIDGNIQTDSTHTPVIPYQTTQFATLGGATMAQSTYDVGWVNQMFQFQMDASHQLADVPSMQSGLSRSTGTLRFETMVPLRINFDLEYNYNVPGSRFQSFMSFSIGDATIGQNLYLNNETGGPLFLDPPSGTFHFNGSIDIPANHEMVMSYQLRIRSTGGNSSVIGNANGHVNITMEAVPEPHTALLLLCIAPFAVARRHRAKFARNSGRFSPDTPSL